MPLPLLVNLAAEWAGRVLAEGDLAIDATVGNGHDTARLARLVGPSGRVLGFDVQPEALERTRRKLQAEQLEDRVHLILDSHANLASWVAPGARARAIVFNLGYLPGGNSDLTTQPESTLAALEAALGLLSPGGLLIVVAYPGHRTGKVEAEAVARWAASLPQSRADVLQIQPLNTRLTPPMLLLIEAAGGLRPSPGQPTPRPGPAGDVAPESGAAGNPRAGADESSH